MDIMLVGAHYVRCAKTLMTSLCACHDELTDYVCMYVIISIDLIIYVRMYVCTYVVQI